VSPSLNSKVSSLINAKFCICSLVNKATTLMHHRT
jgi:hypothetical protein